MTRIGSIGRLVLALIVLAGGSTGCGIGGLNPTIPSERMLVSVEATGHVPVEKISLGELPVPLGNGDLVGLLFDLYVAPFLERHTELDRCRLVSTSEPADPEPATGIITMTATSICRLGPNKVRVREVVTLTLEPVEA